MLLLSSELCSIRWPNLAAIFGGTYGRWLPGACSELELKARLFRRTKARLLSCPVPPLAAGLASERGVCPSAAWLAVSCGCEKRDGSTGVGWE